MAGELRGKVPMEERTAFRAWYQQRVGWQWWQGTAGGTPTYLLNDPYYKEWCRLGKPKVEVAKPSQLELIREDIRAGGKLLVSKYPNLSELSEPPAGSHWVKVDRDEYGFLVDEPYWELQPDEEAEAGLSVKYSIEKMGDYDVLVGRDAEGNIGDYKVLGMSGAGGVEDKLAREKFEWEKQQAEREWLAEHEGPADWITRWEYMNYPYPATKKKQYSPLPTPVKAREIGGATGQPAEWQYQRYLAGRGAGEITSREGAYPGNIAFEDIYAGKYQPVTGAKAEKGKLWVPAGGQGGIEEGAMIPYEPQPQPMGTYKPFKYEGAESVGCVDYEDWVDIKYQHLLEREGVTEPKLTPAEKSQAGLTFASPKASFFQNPVTGMTSASPGGEGGRVFINPVTGESKRVESWQKEAIIDKETGEPIGWRTKGSKGKKKPTTPPAPEWLPQFAPWETVGEPISKGEIPTPSGQQWARTPWSVLEGVKGYAGWGGERPWGDILSHMEMMLPGEPAGVRYKRWKPARQRA